MLKTMLVAVDGSRNSGRAMDFALDLAKAFDSRLLVLSVYKHVTQKESSLSLVRARQAPLPPDAAMRELAESAVQWATKRAADADVTTVQSFVRRGPPARTIVQFAHKRDVDAIVLGCRGLGDIEGFFLGSVSHKVNALSECTCITVK